MDAKFKYEADSVASLLIGSAEFSDIDKDKLSLECIKK